MVFVRPVAILKALFCAFGSFCILVLDTVGAQLELEYLIVVLLNYLYVHFFVISYLASELLEHQVYRLLLC